MPMRAALACLVAVAAALLAPSAPAAARTSARTCRDACRAAIFACAQQSGRPSRCGRSMVRSCRRRGIDVCRTAEVPGGSTTTTTLPSMPGVRISGTVVDVVFALDTWNVAGPGSEYVLVDVAIENDGSETVAPYGIQLLIDALGYSPLFGRSGSQACDQNVAIWPGGRLACRYAFLVPEGVTSANPVLGWSPSSVVAWGDAFAIPAPPPRPAVRLVVDQVSQASGACVPRPGFQIVRVGLTLGSVNGAEGLTLEPSAFVLTADGAVYQPSYCDWSSVDACVGAIGVPVNGTASCTLSFEFPIGAPDPALVFMRGGYAVTAPLD